MIKFSGIWAIVGRIWMEIDDFKSYIRNEYIIWKVKRQVKKLKKWGERILQKHNKE